WFGGDRYADFRKRGPGRRSGTLPARRAAAGARRAIRGKSRGARHAGTTHGGKPGGNRAHRPEARNGASDTGEIPEDAPDRCAARTVAIGEKNETGCAPALSRGNGRDHRRTISSRRSGTAARRERAREPEATGRSAGAGRRSLHCAAVFAGSYDWRGRGAGPAGAATDAARFGARGVSSNARAAERRGNLGGDDRARAVGAGARGDRGANGLDGKRNPPSGGSTSRY